MLSHPQTLLPPPDDAGALELRKGVYLFKIDGFALSRALYPWCSLRDFGYRGVCAAASDVIAKGCRPCIAMVSIGLPPKYREFMDDVVEGVLEAAKDLHIWIENMDTNAGDDGWIDVALIAECPSKPIPRYARPGAIVVLADRVGLGGAAYFSYVRGERPLSPAVALHACRPIRVLKLLEVAPRLRYYGVMGSIDISDTLYEALTQLLEKNGVGLYIDADPSHVLSLDALAEAQRHGINALRLLMTTAEEYIPILVVDPSHLDSLLEALRSVGLSPGVLGYVTSARGLTYRGAEVSHTCWNHFIGSIV